MGGKDSNILLYRSDRTICDIGRQGWDLALGRRRPGFGYSYMLSYRERGR